MRTHPSLFVLFQSQPTILYLVVPCTSHLICADLSSLGHMLCLPLASSNPRKYSYMENQYILQLSTMCTTYSQSTHPPSPPTKDDPACVLGFPRLPLPPPFSAPTPPSCSSLFSPLCLPPHYTLFSRGGPPHTHPPTLYRARPQPSLPPSGRPSIWLL